MPILSAAVYFYKQFTGGHIPLALCFYYNLPIPSSMNMDPSPLSHARPIPTSLPPPPQRLHERDQGEAV